MKLLPIAINENIDELKKSLNHMINDLKIDNLEYKEDIVDDTTHIQISCADLKNFQIIKMYLSNILSQYIIDTYEEKIVARIININYGYFNTKERKAVKDITLNDIIDINKKDIFNSLCMLKRKNIIVKRLIEYLNNNSEIILDGFVNFRLKEYMEELEEAVDKAVDDYITEKEYNEFIKLLRYFVEIQESKVDTINIIINKNQYIDNKLQFNNMSQYILLDENYLEIKNEYVKDLNNELIDGQINQDDLLVSLLITLAPNNIIVHGHEYFKNKELIETIKNVFFGKVRYCDQCDLCQSNSLELEHMITNEYIRK